ncbi:FHA domain-containing protein [Pseudidiomarina homiensis]|uniref:FHA domain-containing protein n=1 Tax=Pseudidiomarina homiensis TaxID=364198 RepID=A0A432Y7E1_9GAMM|nr:FHA domain-containing protein [Pseudidiomarina homiensis]RUO56863.1 hypothetical protein CWI70_09060 [Pseudidiomarina homiensis]
MPALFDCVYQNRFAPRISLFEAKSYVVGRDPECDIVIEHPTVSRRHCVMTFHDGQWRIQDLQSTNGLNFLGKRHSKLALEQRLVFQLGSVTCVLQAKNAQELTVNLNRRIWGQQQLRAFNTRWRNQHDVAALLPALQFNLAQILGSDRCAVLLFNATHEATLASDFPGWMKTSDFDGTTTLINAAVKNRRPYVVNNALLHEQLKHRASVQKAQIKAAFAYPIEVEGKVIAVIYADSLEDQHYFTDHDIDLIDNFSSMLAFQLQLKSLDQQLDVLAAAATSLAV